ncbi:MAG: hypothetical protein M4579_002399 [Chaenotheca gracillima]|nr:MAG: hypothetical protein M4579_002399 [Chaenotheca gracillima]
MDNNGEAPRPVAAVEEDLEVAARRRNRKKHQNRRGKKPAQDGEASTPGESSQPKAPEPKAPEPEPPAAEASSSAAGGGGEGASVDPTANRPKARPRKRGSRKGKGKATESVGDVSMEDAGPSGDQSMMDDYAQPTQSAMDDWHHEGEGPSREATATTSGGHLQSLNVVEEGPNDPTGASAFGLGLAADGLPAIPGDIDLSPDWNAFGLGPGISRPPTPLSPPLGSDDSIFGDTAGNQGGSQGNDSPPPITLEQDLIWALEVAAQEDANQAAQAQRAAEQAGQQRSQQASLQTTQQAPQQAAQQAPQQNPNPPPIFTPTVDFVTRAELEAQVASAIRSTRAEAEELHEMSQNASRYQSQTLFEEREKAFAAARMAIEEKEKALADAKTAEAARDTAAAEARRVAEDLSKFKESALAHARGEDTRIAGLTEERDRLKEEKKRLSEESGSLRAESGSLRAENGGLRAEKESLRAEQESLRAESGSLRAEEESLRAEKESLRAEKEALVEDQRRLAADKDRLTDDNGRQSRELDNLRRTHREETDDVQHRFDREYQDRQGAEERVAELEARIRAVSAERDTLRQSAHEGESRVRESAAEVLSLADQLETTRADNAALDEANEQLKLVGQMADTRVADAKRCTERVEGQLIQQRAHAVGIRRQLDEAQAAHVQHAATETTLAERQKELDAVRDQVEILTAQVADLQGGTASLQPQQEGEGEDGASVDSDPTGLDGNHTSLMDELESVAPDESVQPESSSSVRLRPTIRPGSSRLAAITTAASNTVDQGIQTEQPAVAEQGTQTASFEYSDLGTQTIESESRDFATQTIVTETRDVGVGPGPGVVLLQRDPTEPAQVAPSTCVEATPLTIRQHIGRFWNSDVLRILFFFLVLLVMGVWIWHVMILQSERYRWLEANQLTRTMMLEMRDRTAFAGYYMQRNHWFWRLTWGPTPLWAEKLGFQLAEWLEIDHSVCG